MNRYMVPGLIRRALEDGRSPSAGEAAEICGAFGIPVPAQRIATDMEGAVRAAEELGHPVALKVLSPTLVHKTDVGGVALDLGDADAVRAAFERVASVAADVEGVLVQPMAPPGLELVIGSATDPTFGKVVMFGLGGTLVDTLRDVTFGLAPVSHERARSMLGQIAGEALLDGVRGRPPVDRDVIAELIVRVSELVTEVPEIAEVDLNPVIVSGSGPLAVDARISVAAAPEERAPMAREAVRKSMKRIMRPRSVAVIGASAEEGKIGHSVVKNILEGGFEGAVYPVNRRAPEILGLPAYPSIADVPGEIDVAVFAIPAALVAGALEEAGAKGVAAAVLIPSGFAEIGEVSLQEELVSIARSHGIRLMGPNIFGYYSTPARLCATFCTPYTEQGGIALSSQSGGIGMAMIGYSRAHQMGVSAIVGLGNKADLDEDDLLEHFANDRVTRVVAMHLEDLKDGRGFVEAARRITPRKPVVVLKAGRTEAGARAAVTHTGALAGADAVYDAAFREAGVIRARTLEQLLDWAHALSVLPPPQGENVLIVTGAGGSGVLLSDACSDFDLRLMAMPEDLAASFDELIPPFGASGNPIDITGGEPPETYRRAVRLALRDDRVHALILGYWHTIITPPLVFAELVSEEVEAARASGIEKPVVASLMGDREVEEACRSLERHGILAYPYATERPVAALAAAFQRARLLTGDHSPGRARRA